MVKLEIEEMQAGKNAARLATSRKGKKKKKKSGKITPQLIAQICEDREDLYTTPGLNTKLFLHYLGIGEISGLEEWGRLKNVWLDHNSIRSIQGLDALSNLTCLFLENNYISTIEGLDSLSNLVHLNLSENQITKVEGLASCKSLFTLELQKNAITDIQGLSECPSIGVLNLIGNEVGENTDLIAVLETLPHLSVFYGKGNPVISTTKQYRKRLISRMPSLNFLDNRPVMEVERLCAEAWAVGGTEAEKKAKADFHAKTRAQEEKNMQDWKDLRAEQKARNEPEPSNVSYYSIEAEDEEDVKTEEKEPRQYVKYSTIDDPNKSPKNSKNKAAEADSDDEAPPLEDVGSPIESWPEGWERWDTMLLELSDEMEYDFVRVSNEMNQRMLLKAFSSDTVRLRYAHLEMAHWASSDLFF